MKNIRFTVACLATVAYATTSHAESWHGKVVGVADGDTITVLRDGKPVKIRLHGIDAPESDQLSVRPDGERWRRGQQASFALADHIGRSVVRCEPKDRDRYSPSATQPTASTI